MKFFNRDYKGSLYRGAFGNFIAGGIAGCILLSLLYISKIFTISNKTFAALAIVIFLSFLLVALILFFIELRKK
jgi:hypothetical protein